jgi:SAM-dependent methyltransferase
VAFEELKERQRVAWGAAPFESIEGTIAPMHDDLVRRLGPRHGQQWLDLGCGTGAVAMRAARAKADVTALDLSEVMVETARRRSEAKGLSISYDVGDCENLPYADGSFDVVSSSVGVIFAPDHPAVARELARVVRPGGRLGLTSWPPEGRVADTMRLAGRFQPPLPEGAGNPFAWGEEQRVRALLGDAFHLEFHAGAAMLTGESGEELWQRFASGLGPTKLLVDSLEPERLDQFHRESVALFEEDREGHWIRQSREYLLTLGTRR